MVKKYSEEAYLATIDALMSASPSFGVKGAEAYKPGLERSVAMDKLSGSPSSALRCIHVAGTNGKGSVCNMLAACLAAGGMKVGLYTSPHILDFRERIRIVQDGSFNLVPKEWAFDFLQTYRNAISEFGLSFFEITTAMCFNYFAQQKVDIAVIETGLGGRFDATNIIVPELSVITNIGYDHMDILGDTLEKIAAEKAGIIKSGVPVVVGERDIETAGVFEQAAEHEGSRLYFADDYVTDTSLPKPDEMDLPGSYQVKNLRTVSCALRVAGFEPDASALKHAAGICGFHARWEKIMDEPVTICDIGHNEHGLKYNFAQLEKMLADGVISELVMVYGSVKDKDVDAVLRLFPSQANIFFTAADNLRAMPAEELGKRYAHVTGRSAASSRFEVCPSVDDAVAAALDKCRGMSKPLLYIGGSTYVVSEALVSLGIEYKS